MNRVRYPYIPNGLVIFEPVRRLPSRPTTAEMCGTLPNAFCRVLPLRYARALVEREEMMWSTLTFFRHERSGRPDSVMIISGGRDQALRPTTGVLPRP